MLLVPSAGVGNTYKVLPGRPARQRVAGGVASLLSTTIRVLSTCSSRSLQNWAASHGARLRHADRLTPEIGVCEVHHMDFRSTMDLMEVHMGIARVRE